MVKEWTGERLETFIYTRDTIEHLHRYSIAKEYVKGKIVLDIACGEGYGSRLLSEDASFVYGVDIDLNTINSAKTKYRNDNIKFLEGDTSGIPIDDNSLDVVISFETLEHHNKQEEMMLEIKRVLRPNGILIISTPDRYHYSDVRNFNNIFHVKELYKDEFYSLLSRFYSNTQFLVQKYYDGNSIILNEKEQYNLSFFNGDYSNISLVKPDPLYLISIVSDSSFQEQKLSIFNGNELLNKDYLNKCLDIKLGQVYNSNSYKVGAIILFPFKYLKKLLKNVSNSNPLL